VVYDDGEERLQHLRHQAAIVVYDDGEERLQRLRHQAQVAREARLKQRASVVKDDAEEATAMIVPQCEGTNLLLATESSRSILDERASSVVASALRQPLRAMAAMGNLASTAYGKCVSHFFVARLGDRPLRGMSWAAEKDMAGVPDMETQTFQNRMVETAGAIFVSSRMAFGSLVSKFLGKPDVYEPVMLMSSICSDEVSITMRTPEASSSDVRAVGTKPIPQLLKVLETLLTMGILIRCLTTTQFIFERLHLPCPLQHLDRCTADNLLAAYLETVNGIGLTTETINRFPIVVGGTCMDLFSGNQKMLNSLASRDPWPGSWRIRSQCDVHRFATCQGYMYDLVDGHVSGLLATALGQRGCGKFALLRDSLTEVLTKRFRMVRQPPATTIEATAYRSAVLALLLPTQDVDEASGLFKRRALRCNRRRLAFDRWVKGDIRDRFIYVYEHPDSGKTEEAVLAEFCRDMVAAILPSMLPVFPRHRWVGAQVAVTEVTLLCLVHDLFGDLMQCWGSKCSIVPRDKKADKEAHPLFFWPISLSENAGLAGLLAFRFAGKIRQRWSRGCVSARLALL